MNYYDILGISQGAGAEDIKRAYFARVRESGPDRDADGFKVVREAYDVLRDEGRRAEYDRVLAKGLPVLLDAGRMFEENKFKEAAELLAGEVEGGCAGADVVRMYAEALWRVKKSRTALKVCDGLLEKDAGDWATLVLRGKIAASMGHTQKSEKYFERAAAVCPNNPKVWVDFMIAAKGNGGWLGSKHVVGIFKDALKVSEDIFAGEYYHMYMYGGNAMNEFGWFMKKNNGMPYVRKFFGYFVEDENIDKGVYGNALEMVVDLLKSGTDEDFDVLEKVLPVFESSKHRRAKFPGDDDITVDEKLEIARNHLVLRKMDGDDGIHDSLHDLTAFVMKEVKDEIRAVEAYIVLNLPHMQQPIRHLWENYPEQYELNKKFYDECLDNRKLPLLLQKYQSVRRIPAYGEQVETFVRQTEKTSRNAPCPCGSGRKFKQCCIAY